MGGRPINASRQLALITGDKTYIGMVHAKCGTTERYLSGGCAYCGRAIATEQREARKYLQAHEQEQAVFKQDQQDGVGDPEVNHGHIADLDSADEDAYQESIDDLM